MAVTNGRGHRDGKEEGIDETPIDVLILIAVNVDQTVVLCLQQLADHITNVLFRYVGMVDLFDMFCLEWGRSFKSTDSNPSNDLPAKLFRVYSIS